MIGNLLSINLQALLYVDLLTAPETQRELNGFLL